MEDYKRKKKSDKAKRNKELYGKYSSKHIRDYTQKIEFKSNTGKHCVCNLKKTL